jgi:hypothetical protein
VVLFNADIMPVRKLMRNRDNLDELSEPLSSADRRRDSSLRVLVDRFAFRNLLNVWFNPWECGLKMDEQTPKLVSLHESQVLIFGVKSDTRWRS